MHDGLPAVWCSGADFSQREANTDKGCGAASRRARSSSPPSTSLAVSSQLEEGREKLVHERTTLHYPPPPPPPSRNAPGRQVGKRVSVSNLGAAQPLSRVPQLLGGLQVGVSGAFFGGPRRRLRLGGSPKSLARRDARTTPRTAGIKRRSAS